jgi:endonuclease/exonuclease/phosphatase family metal-dependent hydrolase
MSSRKDLLKAFDIHIKTNHTEFVPKSNHIRVMTWNVQMFKDYKQNFRMNDMFALLINSNADVVFLCEALFNSDYRQQFDSYVKTTHFKYIEFVNPKYGINLVLSKHPIVKKQIISLPKDPIKNQSRYGIAVSIKINESANLLKIVGTHLDVYDETENTRKQQIDQIMKLIDHEYIILGDFNSLRQSDYSKHMWDRIVSDDLVRHVNTQNQVTHSIESNGWVDSFVICNKTPPTVSVWSMRRVDYIYIGQHTPHKIVDTNIHVTNISDHFPIYVDLLVK